jgi:hypothetical protein
MIRKLCLVASLLWPPGYASDAFGLEYSLLRLDRDDLAKIVNHLNKAKPLRKGVSVPVSARNNAYSVRFKGGKLHYDFAVLVPNHCYQKGRVNYLEKKPDKSGRSTIVFDVEILHQPGLCAQSVKTLKYSGAVAPSNGKPAHVYVRILNRFSGSETVEQVF